MYSTYSSFEHTWMQMIYRVLPSWAYGGLGLTDEEIAQVAGLSQERVASLVENMEGVETLSCEDGLVRHRRCSAQDGLNSEEVTQKWTSSIATALPEWQQDVPGLTAEQIAKKTGLNVLTVSKFVSRVSGLKVTKCGDGSVRYSRKSSARSEAVIVSSGAPVSSLFMDDCAMHCRYNFDCENCEGPF